MANLQFGSTEAEIMTFPTWIYLKEAELAATTDHVLNVVIIQLPLLPEYKENQLHCWQKFLHQVHACLLCSERAQLYTGLPFELAPSGAHNLVMLMLLCLSWESICSCPVLIENLESPAPSGCTHSHPLLLV